MIVSSNESLRAIRGLINAPRVHQAPGFDVAFLRPDPIGGGMDPFLQIDAFALAEPVFKPHPHAGFNAVTYILPESPLGFINRDSLGTRNRIGPGSLHWTSAGRGMLHEEIPEVRGTAVLGLQIFINLPRAKKQMEPGFLHLDARDVPVVEQSGSLIRVVAGESNGARSPIETPTPGVRLIDVTLGPHGSFEQSLVRHENAFLWVITGSLIAQTRSGDQELRLHDLVVYEPGGTRIRLQTGQAGAHLVLFAGPPLNEPIAVGGPFVMSSEAELEQAFLDYRAGRMGSLSTSRYSADGRPQP